MAMTIAIEITFFIVVSPCKVVAPKAEPITRRSVTLRIFRSLPTVFGMLGANYEQNPAVIFKADQMTCSGTGLFAFCPLQGSRLADQHTGMQSTSWWKNPQLELTQHHRAAMPRRNKPPRRAG